jgi:hypothetical protein
MDLFVEVCMETHLREFKPQELANVINGEHRQLLWLLGREASGGCC